MGVAEALRAAGLPVDQIGLIAVPLGGGAPLLSANANVAMNPASTMKLVTTYAALSILGADYRWRTGAYLRGRLADGVLDGDLVIKGGGDPKLVIEDLTEFVAHMRAAGLRQIRGDLVLDDGIYELDATPDGRSDGPIDGDPSQPYNVRPFGALMNFKATKVIVRPSPGGLSIALDPPLADVVIENDLRPVRGGCRHGAPGVFVRDSGAQSRIAVRFSGPYSPACGEQAAFVAMLTHRQFIHGLFKAAWQAAGGAWEGRTRVERGVARGAAWVEWTSPRTMADVVQDINKFSNNLMARHVMLQTAVSPTGAATLERARRVVREWLDAQGLGIPELRIDNGSGLSRHERISAAGLAQVLISAAASPVADLIRGSMPVVGVDGTMRSRLAGDPVAGNAWIKTGSLNDVRAIAGYVNASSGRRYAVVLLINGPRAEISQPAQDAVLRWVHRNG